MILTLENTALAGKPVDVFDADGRMVEFCTYADTETGEVERLAIDQFQVHMNEVPRVKEVRPAPLTVVEVRTSNG